MAQDSAFHDGTTVGHAASADVWKAPYSSAEYSDFYSKLIAGNSINGYVIPGYGNNLAVTASSPAAMNVKVDTGAAFIRGRLYENTVQETLAIAAADPANPRLDRVILRYDSTLQTIVLAILAGTAAAAPALPALTQTAATYEVSLGYVWVAAAVASIAEEEVHDEREFLIATGAAVTEGNLIRNSEYIGYSSNRAAIGTTEKYPDLWGDVSNKINYAVVAIPAEMSRGNAVQMTANNSVGVSDGLRSPQIEVLPSTWYSIKILVKMTNAGDIGYIRISDGTNVTMRYLRRSGSFYTERIYYKTSAAPTLINILCGPVATNDVMTIGQCIMKRGYYTGEYQQFHEYVEGDYVLTSTSWDGDARSTSSPTVGAADFEGLYTNINTVNLLVAARDSGSAAGAPYVYAGNLRLRLAGNTNDAIQTVAGLSRFGVTVNISATGASTCDVWLEVLGVYT